MLFNSYEFVLAFLPATLLVFFILGRLGLQQGALFWLICASFFFYGWWESAYIPLLVTSIAVNFVLGTNLQKLHVNEHKLRLRKTLLTAGIVFNLSLLGYYKYANFFVDNLNALLANDYNLTQVVLPLAISFFTFQQIAFLVDAYKGIIKDLSFLHYCLFVTFFPQLIAGPIVHHAYVLPQFAKAETFSPKLKNILVGLGVFTLGLFKKVVIADGFSGTVGIIFNGAENGIDNGLLWSWIGVTSYAFQVYFDFSGYSDMAIGIGRMFGIKLPINFCSPFKAVNIADFWKRWHKTLTNFLLEYLYIPLGGSKKGAFRFHINLLITFILSGLWHGANWTFVAWGGMHGLLLILNNYWRELRLRMGHDLSKSTVMGRGISIAITFTVFAFSMALFRADSLVGSEVLMKSMLGMGETGFNPEAGKLPHLRLLLGFVVAFFAPNLHQLFFGNQDCCNSKIYPLRAPWLDLTWQPNLAWTIVIGGVFMLVIMILDYPSEFLYYQF